ncbi:MAG: ABC transporter substrate-binding protein [Bacteroidota bacterium]
MGKSTTCILLAALLAFASCEKKSSKDYLQESIAQGKKIFRYNQAEGLSSLDPAFARNQANVWAANQLYNGLFELDADLQVTPALVDSWEISPDGLTYTFRLRKGIYFHDSKVFANGKGREVTAQDFVYSFKRIVSPATNSTGAWIFNDKVLHDAQGKFAVNCFEAIGTHTLKIRLQKPFPPFLEVLSMPYTYVIPHEAIEKYGKEFREHPVGTGPFVFRSWDEGNDLILVKNEKYWRRDAENHALPYLDAVQVSFIPDKNQAFRTFAQGKLSFLSGIEEGSRDAVLNKDGSIKESFSQRFHVQKSPYLNTEYLGIQLDPSNYADKNHPLLDKRVRQALNYAIDRRKMVTFLQNNLGKPGTSGIIPNAIPAFDTTIVRGYDYNPEKAQQLLKEAGYPGGNGLPTITLYINPPHKERCEYLQKQWAAIGVNVSIEINQFTAHQEMVDNGRVNFFRASWVGDYPDAENYLSMFYSKNKAPFGPNKTGFKNTVFDALYENAQMESDMFIRYEMYSQMEKLVLEEAPVVVLFYDEALRLTQSNIEGLGSNAMNNLSLEKVNIRPTLPQLTINN